MIGSLRFKFLGILDVFYSSLVILCTILYFVDNEGITFGIYKLILLLFLLFLIIYLRVGFVQNRLLYSSLMLPSYILLISLLIVNLQNIVNVLVGLAPISYYLDGSHYSSKFGKVLYIGIIAIISFARGNLVEYKNFKTRIPTHNKIVTNALFNKLFVLLVCLSFFMFIVNIDIVAFLTGVDYKVSGASTREIDTSSYWEMLFEIFNTITIGLYTYRNGNKDVGSFLSYIKKFPILYIVVNVVYLTMRLLSGDRGPLMYTILLFFFSYIYLRRKLISNILIIAFLLFGTFVISTLNVFRNLSSDRDLIDKIEYTLKERNNTLENKSISPSSQELATSILCNFIAINDIEEGKTRYQMGKYNFFELFGSIPGSNFLYSSLTGESFFKINTTEYLTISFFGEDYLIGLGTTAIADFYLDFGVFGVIIGFLLLGIIFKYVDFCLNCRKGSVDIFSLIMILKLASMALYIPRSSLSFVLGRALYCILIFYFIIIVIRLINCIINYANVNVNRQY